MLISNVLSKRDGVWNFPIPLVAGHVIRKPKAEIRHSWIRLPCQKPNHFITFHSVHHHCLTHACSNSFICNIIDYKTNKQEKNAFHSSLYSFLAIFQFSVLLVKMTLNLPEIPCSFDNFVPFLTSTENRQSISEAVEPFKNYEAKLREVYAQEPDHPAATQNHLVPIYQDGKANLKIRARDISSESKDEQERYLLPLPADKRRKDASSAITDNLGEFQKNFTIFSESALSDLDWSNVVAAGSSVVTALLPVDSHGASKV